MADLSKLSPEEAVRKAEEFREAYTKLDEYIRKQKQTSELYEARSSKPRDGAVAYLLLTLIEDPEMGDLLTGEPKSFEDVTSLFAYVEIKYGTIEHARIQDTRVGPNVRNGSKDRAMISLEAGATIDLAFGGDVTLRAFPIIPMSQSSVAEWKRLHARKQAKFAQFADAFRSPVKQQRLIPRTQLEQGMTVQSLSSQICYDVVDGYDAIKGHLALGKPIQGGDATVLNELTYDLVSTQLSALPNNEDPFEKLNDVDPWSNL
jgi:hypothetical protein